MKKVVSLILVVLVIGILANNRSASATPVKQEQPATREGNSGIRVTIASVGPMLGPPTARYHVGEQIPITIQLTNTSKDQVYSCVSGDLYQDVPRLTKNGELVPYMTWQTYLVKTADKDRTCENEGLPDLVLLRPNEPIIVDYLMVTDDETLPTGAIAWYDQLTPGTYQLSVQRRFTCCDGPTVESNQISFEVVK